MTWQVFFDQYINLEPGLIPISLRLLCAMIVGSLIGMEREYTHRPAGLRTHILVALGACVASIMGEMIFHHFSTNADPARLSAQVITGVGFLGAGTIMKEGANVKGLTTAASVWAVACLGIAAGFGYYALAIVGMLFTLITLTIFEALQRKFIHSKSAEDHFSLQAEDLTAALETIHTASKDLKVSIFDLNVQKQENGYTITFRAWFVGRHSEKHRTVFFAAMASAEGIRSVTNAPEVKV